MLLIALIAPWSANAQETVEIGDGTSTSNQVPIGTYYNYSITEQLYTADEIGMAGTISSISFYYMGIAAKDLPITVYMANVDAADLTTGISLADADEVFSGTLSVTTTAGWVTIDLDTPFAYDGTSNLLIGFNKDYLYYFSGQSWQCTNVTNMARYSQNDNNAYDLTTVPSNVSSYRPNIQMVITPGSGPVCEKPATFEVSNITGYGADFTWATTDAGNYTFEYKKATDSEWRVVDGLTANTYTLSELEPMTAYNARVKAVCGTDFESGYKTANFTTKEVCPDGKICIGEGTATSTYLPTYNYYNYSLTEQIYTAEEIGQAGAILSVDIYSVGTATRTLEFYMVSTEKETFTDGTDWIAATASDLVYNGSVTFAANSWNTIEFDNPFIYDGHSNVALIVRDMTGSYVSSINFFVFDAPSQAIRIYRDDSAYDLANPGTGTVMDVKNRVRLVVGEPPACPKPTALAVDYQGGTEATISWTSDAEAWNMRVNGTEINGTITNPYTLTGLELATTYEVEVQANCGDATSDWVGPVSFTTDNCMPEDQCALTFVVTDSYGDGWNGASIQIYDYTGEELGDLLATVANENLDGQTGGVEETQTITLNFCNGQELAILWTSGSYDDEASYTVTDINGDVVVEGSGAGFDGFAYTMNCTETDCRRPTDFVASEIGNHSVKLSWTENGPATSWKIEYISANDTVSTTITVNTNPYILTGLTPETMYAAQVTPVCEVDKPSEVITWTTEVACPKPSDLNVTPYPFTADVTWEGFAEAYDIEWAQPVESTSSAWLQYDNGTLVSNVGSATAGTRTWGVMYPADMLEGNTLTKIAFYEVSNSYYTDGTVTLNVYSGGDTAPETLIGTKTIATEGTNGMREVVIDPIEIDASQNLWITLTANATYCMTMSAQDGGANSRWFLNGSNWVDFSTVYTAGATYSYMIRGFVETTNYSAWNWSSESGITSPYTITGLEAETDYAVRVKAVCGGEDGESLWTWAYFTTPSACDTPVELEATDITYNAATLNWVGYQDSYNLRYREAVKYDAVWEDDFENGLDQWTLVQGASATGSNWYTIDLTTALDDVDALSGTHCASSWSWSTYAYQTDNWLITPQLDLQGVVKYYVRTNMGYPDHYEVLLSTTDADTTNFTVTLQEMATAPATEEWNEVVIDLSAYAGQQGYIAIHHVDYDANYLLIENFGIYNVIEATAWIDATTTEPTYALTGLTPETEYEWQVQGVNASCDGGLTEWTEIQNFTTAEQTTATQTIALVEGFNWISANVEITLDDLKAALVAALPGTTSIKINSQGNGTTTYNGSRWRGQLTTLDLSQMVMVEVLNGCEITLEGMPINPAEHPFTVNANNVAWIAFPLSGNMTLTDAFAGFALNQDKVNSQNGGSATYTGRWRGQLTELEPGKGYIFESKTNEVRTFAFATSKSKAGVQSMQTSDLPLNVKTLAPKTVDIRIAPKAQGEMFSGLKAILLNKTK